MPEIAGPQDAEEVISMLKAFEAAGGKLDPEAAPDELKDFLRLVEEAKGGSAAPRDEGELVTPEPGFVIKTVDGSGAKYFINLCTSPKVAAPGSWQEGKVPDNVKEALEALAAGEEGDAEALRFPLSLGEPRRDEDRSGLGCTTVDCIMNLDVVRQAQQYRPLKKFLIGLVMRWVEQKQKITLDHNAIKVPKMRYKGSIIHPQTIRADKKPLVRELGEVEGEPAFPLLTSKKAAAKLGSTAAGVAKENVNAQIPAATAAKPGASQAGLAKPSSGGFAFQQLKGTPAQPAAGQLRHTSGAAAGQLQHTSGAAAGQPQHRSGAAAGQLQHAVSYEGSPVEAVLIQVALPEGAPPLSPESVSVEISGNMAHVSVPGCLPVDLQVPFFMTSKGGEAMLSEDARGFRIRLPWKPYTSILDEMVQHAHELAQRPSLYPSEIMELD